MSFPKQVRIVEMGVRDGLQNLKQTVPTELKLGMIHDLADAGIPSIEIASFVSPKWVPQMADAGEILAGLKPIDGVDYPVLTPNLKGLVRALDAGVKEIGVFGAASEGFCQKNTNCSVEESLVRIADTVERALLKGVKVRGYVSCVLGCPFDGDADYNAIADYAARLFEMGCYEISLGDTVGMGTPLEAKKMLATVAKKVPMDKLAIHFHDTRGQALANIFACLELGVSVIDSSVAGLGGCPYAPGATGNVATDDVVYMLHGMGIETGIDLEKVCKIGDGVCDFLDIPNQSRIARVFRGQQDCG